MKRLPVCILLCTTFVFGMAGCGNAVSSPPRDNADVNAPDVNEPDIIVSEVDTTDPGTPEVSASEVSTSEVNASDSDITEPSVSGDDAAADDTASKSQEDDSRDFYISEITDEIWKRIEGKSYKADCTVPLEDLKYIHVLHKDINGVTREGEMVCNASIAEDLIEIFRELYDAGYPIEKMRLVDEYNADDELSMEDNNSSCFNFRFISHTTKVSKHGLGLAVDINTLYNPYIKYVDGKRVLEPVTAEEYLDRDKEFDYKISKGDLCYRLFTEHGFEWGGDWTDRKDYQHFEIPTDVIEREGLQP